MTHPEITQLVDHLFRQEAGKMVASLTRLAGLEHLELVEEAVQEAMLKAAQQWPFRGIPENPAGWLWQVAKNETLDQLRRRRTLARKLPLIIWEMDEFSRMPEPRLAHEIQDNQLRLIFTCCHPVLSREAQVGLTLRILCGFSISEIARAFLSQEAAISKRLVRARQKIRQANIPYEVPAGPELSARLEVVLEVLYLLFNEGYSASQGDEIIRRELCREAIRLTQVLADHPAGDIPASHALLALMLLHAARFSARYDADGHLLSLAEQDRSQWDKAMIVSGLDHLSRAASSAEAGEYHLQAGIAACHCVVNDYSATDWPRILQLYNLLFDLNPSPVIALNRAIALAEVDGPAAGIEAINAIENAPALKSYHLLYATRAEFYLNLGDIQRAIADFQQALTLTSVEPEQRFLRRKLASCHHTAASTG